MTRPTSSEWTRSGLMSDSSAASCVRSRDSCSSSCSASRSRASRCRLSNRIASSKAALVRRSCSASRSRFVSSDRLWSAASSVARLDDRAHPELADHPARDLAHLLEVGHRPRRHPAEHEDLRDAAGEAHGHLVAQLLARHEEPLLVGQAPGVAERRAARDDRDLVHGRHAEQVRHQRMPRLVVRDDPLLFLVDRAMAQQAGDDPLERVVEVARRDAQAMRAARADRGLVAEVREVCTGQPRRRPCDRIEVDVLAERLPAGVHRDDGPSASDVGRRHEYLTIEPAGAQQGHVEMVETVGRGHDDHARGIGEPIELDQQLVERLVGLAVEGASRTCHADRVELVDEDDRGSVRPCGLEELADPSRAEPDVHLDERRGGLREERRARLACDGLGEQGLAGARRPVQQHALRHARTELREALGLTQELDDLHQLRARLLDAGDVVPPDRRLLRLERSGGRHLRHQLDRPPDQVDEQAQEEHRQPCQDERDQLVARAIERGADAGRDEHASSVGSRAVDLDYNTRVRRGLGRSTRPALAAGRPSQRTTSAVKSFSPRIRVEPTP